MDIARTRYATQFINRPIIAILVFMAGLLLSVLIWKNINTQLAQQAENDFSHQAEFTAREIEREIQRYTDFLYDFRAMFNVSSAATPASFDRYVDLASGTDRYPGLVALFFTPDEASSSQPYSDSSFQVPLSPWHRASFEQARDSGLPVATRPIPAIQGSSKKIAIAWYLPLYRDSETPLTVADRRRTFIGVVKGVVMTDKMVGTIQSQSVQQTLRLRITDRGSPGSNDTRIPIYDDRGPEYLNKPSSDDQAAATLSRTILLNAGTRDWELQFRATPPVALAAINQQALLVLAAGIACTVMLYLLIRALSARSETAFANLEEVEVRARYLAQYDFLTGLVNRNEFKERLERYISEARRADENIGLVLLDLDHFKDINDTLGHSIGDKLLTLFSQRLLCQVRESDTVARLGGDEFVVIIPNVGHSHHLATVAEKIIAALSEPCAIEHHDIHPTISVGIAVFPFDGNNAEALMKNADTAMYFAKSRGRNGFQFFTRKMNLEVHERVMLERKLRAASLNDELQVYFQPQIDATSNRILGVEALLRWETQGGSIIPPAQFIPIAEESSLINSLGDWVLEQACQQGRIWHDVGYTDLRIAVNVSARQFEQADLCQKIQTILTRTGMNPANLEIEITESTLIDRHDDAAHTLNELHALGVQIAIDDFGTGYSSLSYLKRFPIDCIKIDQSFIHDIGTDPENQTIVAAIIAMANSLKLRVVAEGVETAAQLSFLRELPSCDLQGYYFSKPMQAGRLAPLLKQYALHSNPEPVLLPHA